MLAQSEKSPDHTTTPSHALKRIRLNLARSKEFPSGSSHHGYEFVAPLDARGHRDPQLWQRYREQCGVRRFWGHEEQIGHLVHKPGGAEHARWVFHYDPATDDDDEAGFRFGSHVFAPGGIRFDPGSERGGSALRSQLAARRASFLKS